MSQPKQTYCGIVNGVVVKDGKVLLAQRSTKEDGMILLVNNTFNHAEDDLLVVSNVFLCKYKAGEARPLEDTVAVKWVGEGDIDNYEFTHANVKNYIIKAFEYLKSH